MFRLDIRKNYSLTRWLVETGSPVDTAQNLTEFHPDYAFSNMVDILTVLQGLRSCI